jgi:PRTRC genetic system protein A
MMPEIRPVAYHISGPAGTPPPAAALYRYVMAGTGVYLQARRTGLEVCIPVAEGEIRGLPALTPSVKLEYPAVGSALVEQMLRLARQSGEEGRLLESLFHLCYRAGEGWQLRVPPQERGETFVRPVGVGTGVGSSYEEALIEVHSHGHLPAFFSRQDDREEQGFRLYGVLGRVAEAPEIRVRVGVYGYFYEVEAGTILNLPPGLSSRSAAEFRTPGYRLRLPGSPGGLSKSGEDGDES